VDVVVRFDDGMMAMTTDYVYGFERDRGWQSPITLTSVRDQHAQFIPRNLTSVLGQKLFAVHDSWLFDSDTTIANILDTSERFSKEKYDIPYLQPLTILAAKYIEQYDFIVWKLKLPDGREFLSASRYQDEGESDSSSEDTFLARSVETLLTSVPSNLSADEVQAISEHKIIHGMSREAVVYSWGTPSKENDFGGGGIQLIFGEHRYVYLDTGNRVTDWQFLDGK
jgi:hypothetical protein